MIFYHWGGWHKAWIDPADATDAVDRHQSSGIETPPCRGHPRSASLCLRGGV